MANNPIRKTLIIRLSSVGDVVLTSKLVRVYRKRFTEGRLDFLVKSEFADIVRYNPNITDVIEFPRGGEFRDLLALRRKIRSENYDLIIDAHDSLRSRFLSFGARRLVRVRKRKLARALLINFKINAYGWFGGSPPVAERYLEPVREFGVKDDGEGLDFYFPAGAADRATTILHDTGIIMVEKCIIGVCPSAKHINKMWLMERFAEVAATLGQERNAPIILFGSADERERCTRVLDTINTLAPDVKVINLAGELSLVETAALMDHCSVVITNDSGLMHVAAARKRNVIAIFGPTVKELGFFPYGTRSIIIEHPMLTCRPCTHIGLPDCPKGHFKCMNEISAHQVIEAARSLLA